MHTFLAVIAVTAFSLTAVSQLAARSVSVRLVDSKGENAGKANITEAERGGALIRLKVRGLPPGEHAAHIHEKPMCEGPAFTSAGGHFNPDHKKHGLDSDAGPHAGDMVNFTVGRKGKGKALLVNPRVNLSDAGDHSILANGGTALVIHAAKDDMQTDPTGNAGARIACGVIK